MSVYKPTGSALYIFDFWRGGRRFFGSTDQRTKEAARAVERAEIAKAEELIRKQKASKRRPMTVDTALGRYWSEVGQYAASKIGIEACLEFCLEQLGKATRLDEITDDDISKLVAVRRTHHRRARTTPDGKPLYKPIENATVNRTVQILRRVFRRAHTNWKVLIPEMPNWGRHLLPEPEERVREARFDEEDQLFDALREDHRPLMEFAKVSGLRQKAALITWPQVDWENREIRYQKKRRRAGEGVVWRTIPITPTIEAILRPLIGHHPTAVFTYRAARTRAGRVKGQRYPITPSGLKSRWRRDRAESGVSDFRWHDWRHTTASRTLRSSRNLGVVKSLLGHENIATTMRYAHVLKEDVAAAIEQTAADAVQRRESQEKSQGAEKKVG